MALIALFIALLFLFSLVARRLESTIVTAPIVFTAAGMLVTLCLPRLETPSNGLELLQYLAEVGLVLLLFTDASRTDLRVLNSIRNLPARLLSTGMLLTIVLGAVCALALFRGLSLWEAGILSAILAPTDAGLGQVIVTSSRVPMRIRQALNVEAGLNDGLSVPFLLFFIVLAVSRAGENAGLTQFILEQLVYGALVGCVIGLAGGALLGFAHRRESTTETWQALGVVALPILCLLVSDAVGASMFIAAFVAGLAVQVRFKEAAAHSVEFTEEWGQLLNLLVFFLFGMIAAHAAPEFEASHVLYALASLTLVRMLPVAIALRGTRLSRPTVLFMGWFGPRGLASIVLGLVFLEHEAHLPGERTIKLAVVATVLVSVFAHGLSAMPGIERYARSLAKLPADAPENSNA